VGCGLQQRHQIDYDCIVDERLTKLNDTAREDCSAVQCLQGDLLGGLCAVKDTCRRSQKGPQQLCTSVKEFYYEMRSTTQIQCEAGFASTVQSICLGKVTLLSPEPSWYETHRERVLL
jgi:hypothetical protein